MLKHNYIGTEHLLLGVIHDPDCVGARALTALEVSSEEVRRRILEIIGEGKEPPKSHIPLTPRAKRVLELSLRQAVRLHHSYLGTGDLLLGLVVEGEGVAAQVLRESGGARHDEVLAAGVMETEVGPEDEGPRDPGELPTEEELIAHARELAGLYALQAEDVESARRLLELDLRHAKARFSLFVRFAKTYGIDPNELARFVLSDGKDRPNRSDNSPADS